MYDVNGVTAELDLFGNNVTSLSLMLRCPNTQPGLIAVCQRHVWVCQKVHVNKLKYTKRYQPVTALLPLSIVASSLFIIVEL